MKKVQLLKQEVKLKEDIIKLERKLRYNERLYVFIGAMNKYLIKYKVEKIYICNEYNSVPMDDKDHNELKFKIKKFIEDDYKIVNVNKYDIIIGNSIEHSLSGKNPTIIIGTNNHIKTPKPSGFDIGIDNNIEYT